MCFVGPSSLNVTITKNIKSSSIVLQWDAVDDSLITNYAITWSRAGGGLQIATPTEQTSYTITGLTLDIVYTITVSAANMCGQGPEFRTSILLSTGTYVRLLLLLLLQIHSTSIHTYMHIATCILVAISNCHVLILICYKVCMLLKQHGYWGGPKQAPVLSIEHDKHIICIKIP